MSQERLKGHERKKNKPVEFAALEYEKARDARMKKTTTEVMKKESLIDVMKKAKLKEYEFEDGTVIEVTLDEKVTVKVKRNREKE